MSGHHRPAGKPLVYALIVCYVTAALMMIGVALYANYVTRESNAKWCGLVSTLDDTYADTPPSTELGKQIAFELNKLRHEFDC